MINTRKVLLGVFAILIPLTAILFTVYLRKINKEEVKGIGVVQKECTPYVTNMIPNISYVGEEYIYTPKIVGCNNEDVEIEFTGASWLTVTKKGIVYGIPSVTDVGIHRVILTVRSVSAENRYVEYVIVE
jgi:hypothetical protein